VAPRACIKFIGQGIKQDQAGLRLYMGRDTL
jgi:hypothetical protein